MIKKFVFGIDKDEIESFEDEGDIKYAALNAAITNHNTPSQLMDTSDFIKDEDGYEVSFVVMPWSVFQKIIDNLPEGVLSGEEIREVAEWEI